MEAAIVTAAQTVRTRIQNRMKSLIFMAAAMHQAMNSNGTKPLWNLPGPVNLNRNEVPRHIARARPKAAEYIDRKNNEMGIFDTRSRLTSASDQVFS
jgi:hypothetical protein